MPGYNGKGPAGAGPMTGRGMGRCNTDPDYGRPVPDVPYGFGRGMGLGRGAGYGCGNGFSRRGRLGGGRMLSGGGFSRGVGVRADELSRLRSEANANRGVIDELKKRISELEKKGA